jgi:hypothetical protein
MIPIQQCKHGYLYRVDARGFRLGVFVALPDAPGFVGIRNKFGLRFLDYEHHYDAHEHYGTAAPTEELGECPLEVLVKQTPDEPQYTTLFVWLNEQESLLGGVR